MQQTSYIRNYVITNQQIFYIPRTLADTNKNDSIVASLYFNCYFSLKKE